MTAEQGRAAYAATRIPRAQRLHDTERIRRSAVARGSAMFAARHRDRDARKALADAATDPPASA